MDPIERELNKVRFAEHIRKQHEAEEAKRTSRTGADHDAFTEARKASRPAEAARGLFAAGFHNEPAAATTAKADPNSSIGEKFAAGFASPAPEHQTVLEKLLAYGERQASQAAPQQAPAAAPLPVVEPSPQARRAEATDAPQGQPGTPEQLPLPLSTAGLFAQLEEKVATVTSAPVLPPDAQLRQAFRNLPGDQRDQIVAQIESQDFGVSGYLGRYQPDYAAVLIGDALCRRLADARRLDPSVTVDRLLEMMATA